MVRALCASVCVNLPSTTSLLSMTSWAVSFQGDDRSHSSEAKHNRHVTLSKKPHLHPGNHPPPFRILPPNLLPNPPPLPLAGVDERLCFAIL